MQVDNETASRFPVIVRAWGDEPVRLLLYRVDNKRCYVGSESSKKPIGIPKSEVFGFDMDRFSSLLVAFRQGDKRKLGELWANMPVDDFACNKYQDKLKSSHDQEHVTDTSGVASGHAQ